MKIDWRYQFNKSDNKLKLLDNGCCAVNMKLGLTNLALHLALHYFIISISYNTHTCIFMKILI